MAKEYEVEIGLYEDAMTPSIHALILEQPGGGLRLTGGKGCGSWNIVRRFKCSLTVADLRCANRSADKGQG
jgi:hypothetical protein